MERSTINNNIHIKLAEKFGEKVAAFSEPYGLLTFVTYPDVIINVLLHLKNELKFNFLTDITAVHYPGKDHGIAVVYHLNNMVEKVRIRVKVFISEKHPHIPTATTIWNAANWVERETYDFFGVKFDGHPDLRRILNMDDLGVHPMLKQYPLEDPNKVDKKDEFFGR